MAEAEVAEEEAALGVLHPLKFRTGRAAALLRPLQRVDARLVGGQPREVCTYYQIFPRVYAHDCTAPAWSGGGPSGRTPTWKQDAISGGRTPAYGADGGRTVNPYADGSRTAYGGAGGVSFHFVLLHTLLRIVTDDPIENTGLGSRGTYIVWQSYFGCFLSWIQNSLWRLWRLKDSCLQL